MGVFFALPDDLALLGSDVIGPCCEVILDEGKESMGSCDVIGAKDAILDVICPCCDVIDVKEARLDVICPCCDVMGADVSETISTSSSLSISMTSLSSATMFSQI